MSKGGLWVVIVGTAMLFLLNVFYTATNFLESYREDWFQDAIKVTGVASTLAVGVVLTGFLISALGRSATKSEQAPRVAQSS